MVNVTRAAVLGALLLGLTLPACTTSPDDPGDELTTNRRHWQSQRIEDYRVQFRLVCFCIREATDPVVLQVRNGAIVAVTRVSDGTAVPPSSWAGRYYTVEQMFTLIAESQAQGAHEVRVTYDPLLRYPTEVFVDRSAGVADDERQFELSGLMAAR